jgi:hypothetical protein
MPCWRDRREGQEDRQTGHVVNMQMEEQTDWQVISQMDEQIE